MPFSFGFSFTYFFLQATAQEVRQAELTVGGSVRLLPAEELDLPDNPPYLRREMLSRVHPHRPDGRSSWLESSPEEEAQKAEEATQNATTVMPGSIGHEAQRLYPAYVGTQRVASAMQAVQYGNAQGAYGSQGNRGRSSKSTAAMLSGSWLLLLTPVLAWW
eukprot:g19433.t1